MLYKKICNFLQKNISLKIYKATATAAFLLFVLKYAIYLIVNAILAHVNFYEKPAPWHLEFRTIRFRGAKNT